MEFLVRQIQTAHGLSPAERERMRVLERSRAAELRQAGTLVKLWRVLGSNDAIGLYCTSDSDALHEALCSLPMFPYMRFEIEALVTHPQEQPARAPVVQGRPVGERAAAVPPTADLPDGQHPLPS